jgi:hypothetical protein
MTSSSTTPSISLAFSRHSLLHLLSFFRRLGHALEADAGAGLVDHVDRLVGQAAAGDVAVDSSTAALSASSVICTRWCAS